MREPTVPFVIAPAELTPHAIAVMVEVAQAAGNKLIDFCNVRAVPRELFDVLERKWRVPGGYVRRLAFVFQFQHYVVARELAKSAEASLAKRGAALRLFYAAQAVDAWVNGRAVADDPRGALLDLESGWDGSNAAAVIDGALELVRRAGPDRRVTLLVRLSWIARRSEGAARAAKLAREAISLIGDAMDVESCELRRQALRSLGGAMFELGDEHTARILFDEAAGSRGLDLASFVEVAMPAHDRDS
jgi:hypothetical protein